MQQTQRRNVTLEDNNNAQTQSNNAQKSGIRLHPVLSVVIGLFIIWAIFGNPPKEAFGNPQNPQKEDNSGSSDTRVIGNWAYNSRGNVCGAMAVNKVSGELVDATPILLVLLEGGKLRFFIGGKGDNLVSEYASSPELFFFIFDKIEIPEALMFEPKDGIYVMPELTELNPTILQGLSKSHSLTIKFPAGDKARFRIDGFAECLKTMRDKR